MSPLIECVPNFSEGRDMTVIKQITDAIEAVEGVKLLDVDPGKATNRTVVTFVGAPQPVIEAAFAAIRTAARLIDMSKHQGEHPREGGDAFRRIAEPQAFERRGAVDPHRPGGLGQPVELVVVEHHRHLVRRGLDVDLDAIALLHCRAHGRART